jgi:hypothetical protein
VDIFVDKEYSTNIYRGGFMDIIKSEFWHILQKQIEARKKK